VSVERKQKGKADRKIVRAGNLVFLEVASDERAKKYDSWDIIKREYMQDDYDSDDE